MRQTWKPRPDGPTRGAHRIVAQHPAWRLASNGKAVPKSAYIVAFCVLTGLSAISWFIPASVLADPYQTGTPTMIGLAIVVALTGLHLWVSLPGLRLSTDDGATARDVVFNGIVALIAPILTFLFAGSVLFRLVPLVAAGLFGSPMVVEREVVDVRRGIGICMTGSMRCVTGRTSRDYRWLEIDGHPNTFSRVIVARGYLGFSTSTGAQHPQRARFEGRGTVLGMRIDKARNLDMRPTGTNN
ncbi:hypothetical protein KUH32_12425 [Thalassococcus sp. CAU 1522]|uniref:DUF304 domain-containing protein n=1 Tax=Thalassococcus arenae TaxID=2851652 RepID=A0ABS6NAN1_9RHOB|nr:hypothetical protein [Thalassococcus arenae]MBV2360585.1 hypothetical protein [Thalassococcus arenae]